MSRLTQPLVFFFLLAAFFVGCGGPDPDTGRAPAPTDETTTDQHSAPDDEPSFDQDSPAELAAPEPWVLEPVATLTGRQFIRFSKTGDKALTVGEDGLTQVWTTKDWQPAEVVPAIGELFGGRPASADDGLFVDDDEAVVVWDRTPTGSRFKKFRIADGEELFNEYYNVGFPSVVVSPDESMIVLCGNGGTVKAISKDTGKVTGEFESGFEGRTRLAFTPDGIHLVTTEPVEDEMGDPDVGFLRMWSTESWEKDKEVQGPHIDEHRGRFVFSPDGKLFVNRYLFGQVEVFDTKTWEATKAPGEYSVKVLAFSPDGAALVTAEDDEFTVHRTPDWAELAAVEVDVPPGKEGIRQVVFSPDGSLLACALGNSIRLWRIGTADE